MNVTLTNAAMGTETIRDVDEIEVLVNNRAVVLDGERYGDEPGLPIIRVSVDDD